MYVKISNSKGCDQFNALLDNFIVIPKNNATLKYIPMDTGDDLMCKTKVGIGVAK